MRHYVRLDAPYLKDDEPEDKDNQGFRTCADPHVCEFLKALANPYIQTRTLITSRLYPYELEGLAGCRREDLENFSLDDALHFFHRQHLNWTRAEVNQICSPYGFVPLPLRLLTGSISKHPWEKKKKLPQAAEIIKNFKGKSNNILEVAYNCLAGEEQQLLSRIAAFRSPVDYKAIISISPNKDKEAVNNILASLIGRGLLLFDDKEGKFDLHPIVRAYSYDRLRDKKGVHTKLRDYFDAIPEPDKIEKLEDLTPVIELYHHTLQMGDYDKACDLFYERLASPLYYTFGAYQLRIELLKVLFPEGEDKLPRLNNKSDQGWTLNALSNSYILSGQPRQSVPLLELQNKLREEEGSQLNLTIGLSNLALDQMSLGELAEAEANLRRRIKICREEIKDEFGEAIGHQELGRCLAYQGKWEEAEKELDIALKIFEKQQAIQSQCVVWAYLSLVAILREDFSQALQLAREAYKIATSRRNERDLIRAEWLLGAACRGNGNLVEAETHINEALSRCRRINNVETEADILLELARSPLCTGKAGFQLSRR